MLPVIKADPLPLTSSSRSPLETLNDLPALMASGFFSRVAKSIRSPTAVSTLPSITTIGGQKKPPMMRATLRMKVE